LGKKKGGKNPDGKFRMVLQMYIEVPRPNEGWKLPTSKKNINIPSLKLRVCT